MRPAQTYCASSGLRDDQASSLLQQCAAHVQDLPRTKSLLHWHFQPCPIRQPSLKPPVQALRQVSGSRQVQHCCQPSPVPAQGAHYPSYHPALPCFFFFCWSRRKGSPELSQQTASLPRASLCHARREDSEVTFPLKSSLAEVAQQELLRPQGRWLVDNLMRLWLLQLHFPGSPPPKPGPGRSFRADSPTRNHFGTSHSTAAPAWRTLPCPAQGPAAGPLRLRGGPAASCSGAARGSPSAGAPPWSAPPHCWWSCCPRCWGCTAIPNGV